MSGASPSGKGHSIRQRRPAEVPREKVLEQVERILASEHFAHAPQLGGFLRFAVEQAIRGKGESLKEYTIAVEVLGRDKSFDSRVDPIGRVRARELRAKLRAYYAAGGARDPVLIEYPKGRYIPVFTRRGRSASGTRKKPSAFR